MATRKYIKNRVEVVDSQGQSIITPKMVFGYSKIENDAQVYDFVSEENGHIYLNPIDGARSGDYPAGSRFLFYLPQRFVSTNAIVLYLPGATIPICTSTGTNIREIDAGWHVVVKDTFATLGEFDLDEKDYIYCDNIINGCITIAEKYMTYDIIPKEYREFRNDLTGDYYETDRLYDNIDGVVFNLRRGAYDTDLQITYTTKNGDIATVPDDEWYLAGNKLVVTGSGYPTADKLECVAIRYLVANEIQPDLYAALMQHISEAYESHGLCSSDSCPAALGMSDGVLAVYNSYRIPRVGA